MEREDYEKINKILEEIAEFSTNDLYKYGWLNSDIAEIAEILEKYRPFN